MDLPPQYQAVASVYLDPVTALPSAYMLSCKDARAWRLFCVHRCHLRPACLCLTTTDAGGPHVPDDIRHLTDYGSVLRPRIFCGAGTGTRAAGRGG